MEHFRLEAKSIIYLIFLSTLLSTSVLTCIKHCIDDSSFSVLSYVFFAENTIHVLVWHEQDGLVGLDSLENNLRLIEVRL